MPTDAERREVAAKLRDMACRTNPSWPALMEALGCPGRAVAVQYLAELIEPKRERTCHNISTVPRKFTCSECHQSWRKANGNGALAYCPNCGARVIQE